MTRPAWRAPTPWDGDAVAPSARLAWVVDQLALRPSDRVLEVGCGHGVAATLVLRQLTEGRYTGLDRSASMVSAAERRNRDAIEAGRAGFVQAPFDGTALTAGGFDVVFAVRVAAMARADHVAGAAGLLAPGGRLVLAFDGPGDLKARQLQSAAAAVLADQGFSGGREVQARLDGQLIVCVAGICPTRSREL